jgi:hypothetical protein
MDVVVEIIGSEIVGSEIVDGIFDDEICCCRRR